MSTLTVGTIKSLDTQPPAIQNTSGTEIGTFCRAWVNFNGAGTVAIRADFNVSSITDNGVGDYTVNFTTAMPDANYCTMATCINEDGQTSTASIGIAGNTTAATLYSTTAVRFLAQRSTGTNEDEVVVCVAAFR